MKTRPQILAENRLENVLEARGVVLHGEGNERSCKCQFHEDGTASMSVNIEKQVWTCYGCGAGGSVIDYLARADGVSVGDVLNRLGSTGAPYRGNGHKNDNGNGKPKIEAPAPQAGEIVATYDYVDQMGRLVYQVCRIQKPNPAKPSGYDKTFRQRQPDGKGGWIWKMDGVTLVLYRLNEIANPKNEFPWIVEGEKDVETLRAIGMTATTNAGGAKKWSDAYSEHFTGKNVILCGDNDAVGKEHMEKVRESIEPYAKSIRRIELPEKFKDITELRESFPVEANFKDEVTRLMNGAVIMMPGGTLPIRSMAEMETEYIEHVKTARTRTVDLARWLPSLACVRSLVPGELVAIIGDTGSGKTYVLQHLAILCQVPTLLFELELPDSLTFERFISIARKTSSRDVFSIYNEAPTPGQFDFSDMSHVFTCSKGRLSPENIEAIILKSELKMGVRPTLVLVDYAQLVRGVGKSRYERIAMAAEEMKIVAKSTGTVIVMTSQVGRDRESPEITLHDAKGAGEIENSSGVVIGLWREPGDAGVMNLRVLKNTKGQPTDIIKCNVDTRCMWITERAAIDDKDVPTDIPRSKPRERYQSAREQNE